MGFPRRDTVGANPTLPTNFSEKEKHMGNMTIWTLVAKAGKVPLQSFLIYKTRNEAREARAGFYTPSNYRIVKFVEQEENRHLKAIKYREDGFRYFERPHKAMTDDKMYYRASDYMVQVLLNGEYCPSGTYATINELLKDKTFKETT
jgi:hypothetical protein